MSKHCSKCNKLKPLSGFYKQCSTDPDKRSACKKCIQEGRKLQRQLEPPIRKDYTKREKEMIEEYLATTHIKESQ